MLKYKYFRCKRLHFKIIDISLQRIHVEIKFFHSLRFRKKDKEVSLLYLFSLLKLSKRNKICQGEDHNLKLI